MNVSPSVAAAFALVIQFVVGAILFIVIAAIAAGLHLVVVWGSTNNAFPPLVGWGMQALEFLVWSADVVCFALFVVSEVWRFCRALWEARKG